MKRIFLTAVVTACVFAAGVFAGMWVQRTQPVPAPPIGIMGEIRDVPLSAPQKPAPTPKNDLPKIKAEVEKIKPEVEEFRKKLEPIKQEFRSSLEAVLTPAQREKLQGLSERTTGTDKPSTSKPQKDGLDSLFPIVVIPSTLDKLTEQLELTAEQRTAVHALLLRRREKFLQLVDASPPPSLKLSKIAPLVPQVAKPEAK
jgi:hypothetical protein